jgi:hypothetical protein
MSSDLADGLDLQQALEEWCRPEMRVTRTMARLGLQDAEARLHWARKQLTYAGFGPHADGQINAATTEVTRARVWLDQIERDDVLNLKARLQVGEYHLRGVMTKPIARLIPANIPGVWATDLVFDLDQNTVDFHGRRYVMVKVHPGSGTGAIVADDATAAAEGLEDADDISDQGLLEKSPRPVGRRGRPSVTNIIEAALDECWDKVQHLLPQDPHAKPNWSGLARVLSARMTRRRKHVEGPPQFDTIRTALPGIYPRVLSRKTAIK